MRAKVALLVVLATLIVVGAVFALDATIDRQVISSGGGKTSSGLFSFHTTIGQPVAGKISSSNHEIQAGFWNGSIPEYEVFLPTIIR